MDADADFDLTPDEAKLEEITTAFVKALIVNKFDDNTKYIELAKRLKQLIDMEMWWKESHEEKRLMMQVWGPVVN